MKKFLIIIIILITTNVQSQQNDIDLIKQKYEIHNLNNINGFKYNINNKNIMLGFNEKLNYDVYLLVINDTKIFEILKTKIYDCDFVEIKLLSRLSPGIYYLLIKNKTKYIIQKIII